MKQSQLVLLSICAAGAFLFPLALRFTLAQWPTSEFASAIGQSSPTAEWPSKVVSPTERFTNAGPEAPRAAHDSSSSGMQRREDVEQPHDRLADVRLANWQPSVPAGTASPAASDARAATDPAAKPSNLENSIPVTKVVSLTCVVLVICFVCLKIAVGNGTSGDADDRELRVCDSLALSREVGVKLIRVGNERIVVGHDRQGMRSMVLLPARFDKVLEQKKNTENINGAVEIAGDLRMALANPEDRGWDLSHQSSTS